MRLPVTVTAIVGCSFPHREQNRHVDQPAWYRKKFLMRVAISAKSTSLGSEVDQRFGRAKYFIVLDTETDSTEVHDNEVNLNAIQGAGIQSAANVAGLGVEAVLTGHVGPNSFRALSAAGIKVYTGLAGTVEQALEDLKDGRLTPVASADVEGHWL